MRVSDIFWVVIAAIVGGLLGLVVGTIADVAFNGSGFPPVTPFTVFALAFISASRYFRDCAKRASDGR
jgi:positive regulator of sigma E activity